MKKLRMAIFDLTDCEGCELQMIALRERLLDLFRQIDLVSWRLIQEEEKKGPIDVTFVEGTPLDDDEIKLLKEVRQKSEILIALGACACLGGVQGMLDELERKKFGEKIYNKEYQLDLERAFPIDHYVKVDHYLNGCPVDLKELEEYLGDLLQGKTPTPKNYSVCFECKEKQNHCLLLDGLPCLGPIISGGCQAACTTNKRPCVGCWGTKENAAIQSMIRVLMAQKRDEQEIENIFKMFLKNKVAIIKELKKYHQRDQKK